MTIDRKEKLYSYKLDVRLNGDIMGIREDGGSKYFRTDKKLTNITLDRKKFETINDKTLVICGVKHTVLNSGFYDYIGKCDK